MGFFCFYELFGIFKRGRTSASAMPYSSHTSSGVAPPARLPMILWTGARVPLTTGLP